MYGNAGRFLAGALLAAALGMTGCGGGGGRSVLPAGVVGSGSQPAPVPGSGTSPGATGSAQFRITIPGAASAAQSRAPQYVSAATKSMAIAIGSVRTVAALTPTSPECTGGAGQTVCVVSVNAPPGNDTFSLSTYASTGGSGTPLSINSTTATIVAGKVNPVNVVLNGVVANVALQVVPAYLPSGAAGSAQVTVQAYDAANNAIVGPGSWTDAQGNPVTVSLSNSDTSGHTSLSSTTATAAAATVTLHYDGAAGVNNSTITAHLGTATATASIAIGQVTFAARQALFTAVSQLYATLPHTSPAADAVAVQQYLLTNPLVSGVGHQGADVWATFTDGVGYEAMLDRVPSGPPGPSHPLALTRGGQAGAATRSAQAEFPTSAALFLVDTYDFSSANAQLFSTALGQAGFTSGWGDASLATLRALPNASILYIDSHGGVDYMPPVGATPAPSATPNSYGLKTSTVVSAADAADAQIQGDLEAGRLIQVQAPQESSVPSTPVMGAATYAITDRFASRYWTNVLTSTALVYISACEGTMAGSEAFHTAVFNAAAPGGTVTVLGWNDSVGDIFASESERFLFDRLLGESAAAPMTVANAASGVPAPESPYQRAFSLPEVFAAMQQHQRYQPGGLTEVQSSLSGFNATLTAVSNTGTGVVAPFLLSPSIELMTINENTSTLTLLGEFGSKAGSVTISSSGDGSAGTALALAGSGWTASSITVAIPQTGAGSSGYVVVHSPGGAISNAVPLTEWDGIATLTGTTKYPLPGAPYGFSGNYSFTANTTLHVREDVHTFRAAPAPLATPAQHIVAFTLRGDSAGSITASGSGTQTFYPNSNGSQPPPYTLSFKGTQTLGPPNACNPGCLSFTTPWGIPGAPSSEAGCPATAAVAGASANVCAQISVQPTANLAPCTDNNNGQFCLQFPGVGSVGGGPAAFSLGSTWTFPLALAADYTLTGGSLGVNCPASMTCNGNQTILGPNNANPPQSIASLSWSFGAPNAPPVNGVTPASGSRGT